MAEPSLFPQQKPGATSSQVAPSHAPKGGLPPGFHTVQEHVTELAGRLAVIEERLGNMRKKSRLSEQNLIEYERDTRTELKALGERLTELSRKVSEVSETVTAMSGELSSVVPRHEFSVLERYLDLWEPLSFITREEAKMLLVRSGK